MNRRLFLKSIGLALALPALPLAAKPKENPYTPQSYKDRFDEYRVPKQYQWPDKFDPTKGCSHGVRYTGRKTPRMQEMAKRKIVDIMESYIPPRYRKYVTYHERTFNWGETHAVGFFYEPPNRRAAIYTKHSAKVRFNKPGEDSGYGVWGVDTAIPEGLAGERT